MHRIPLLFCLLFLIGCDNSGSKANAEALGLIQNRLDGIQKQINAINQTEFDNIIEKVKESSPVLTPSDTGFHTIKTTIGYLFLSLDDIKKYANGYKIILSIGNANFSTFNDVDVTIRYGKDFDKSSQIKLIEGLYPSSWTKATVVLSPAKEDDIARFSITISPNKINLYGKNKETI